MYLFWPITGVAQFWEHESLVGMQEMPLVTRVQLSIFSYQPWCCRLTFDAHVTELQMTTGFLRPLSSTVVPREFLGVFSQGKMGARARDEKLLSSCACTHFAQQTPSFPNSFGTSAEERVFRLYWSTCVWPGSNFEFFMAVRLSGVQFRGESDE